MKINNIFKWILIFNICRVLFIKCSFLAESISHAAATAAEAAAASSSRRMQPPTGLQTKAPYTEEDEISLRRLLATIIAKDMKGCDLIVLFGRQFCESKILEMLVRSPSIKQVASMKSLSESRSPVTWQSSRCQGILLLLSHIQPLLQFGNQNVFSWDYSARVVIAGLTRGDLMMFLQTKKGSKTENIAGIVKTDKTRHYKIYMNELYWGRGLMHITTWRGQNFTATPDLFPDKISNLRRAVLNVITFEYHPSVFYRRDPDGNIAFRYGWDIEVIRTLQQAFNFTAVYKEPEPGGLWGYQLDNGTWVGMVGLIARGEGDLGVANHYNTALAGRREVKDFTTPYADDQSCYLARVDPPLPRWQSIGLPFQMVTWAAIFVASLLAGPILFLLAKAADVGGNERQNLQSLMTTSLLAYGIHFSHPMSTLPRRPSTQVFIAFLWIYAIIITTGYKSTLTASLTISRMPAGMETFKELYESGITVVALGPFFKKSMALSQNRYLRALAKRFISRSSVDVISKEILSGEAVMIGSKRNLEFIRYKLTLPSGAPRVRLMKECFSPHDVGIAIQRNSPLKAKFDQRIQWIFESGMGSIWFDNSIHIYQRLEGAKKHDSTTVGEEGATDADGVIPLSMEHVQGAFIILGIGLAASILVIFLEVFMAKRFDGAWIF